jgi:hypothetical protein
MGKTVDDLNAHIVDVIPSEPLAGEPAAIRPILRRMSDVEPREIETLWPGYIIAHKFNILAGYGGVGKDQMMANVIACFSTDRPMPEGFGPGQQLRVLILAAEDDAHEDWRPRLDANGACVDNVFILDGVAEGDGPLKWVDIKRHMPLVEQVIRQEQIDVVYISPLSAYMPGIERRNGGSVRDTLGYLQRLIDSTGVTVIATLHLGKSAQDRKGAMKVLDSVEFVNAARNVLAINELPDEYQPDDAPHDATRGRHKVLEVVKSNSMIPGPPHTWSRPLDAEVQWHGVSPVGFDASFSVPEPRDIKRQDAKEWLAEYLAGGMQKSTDVRQAAKDAGITDMTLRRAQDDLGVIHKRIGYQGPWCCMLPSGPPRPRSNESANGAHSRNDDVSTIDEIDISPLQSIPVVGQKGTEFLSLEVSISEHPVPTIKDAHLKSTDLSAIEKGTVAGEGGGPVWRMTI